MSNASEIASEYVSDWITIDTDALTDQSLHPFCLQLDSLNLDHQVAVEMGMRIPDGSPSGIRDMGNLSVRTIHSHTKDPTDIKFPTISAEHPVVEATGEGHPGRDFLNQSGDVTALTVTTNTTSPKPIDLSQSSDTSAASRFGATNAGVIGSAIKDLPTECTQDIYVQLLLVPLGDWTPPRHTATDQTATQSPVSVYGVGITVFVAHDGDTSAVPASDSAVRDDATDVSGTFTSIESTPELQYVWRHSTPAEEIIRTPTLKPDPTRYRWVTQRLKLAPVTQMIRNKSSTIASMPNTVLPHVPHARQLIGTPAKIRLQRKDLAWLLGPPAQSSDHQPHP